MPCTLKQYFPFFSSVLSLFRQCRPCPAQKKAHSGSRSLVLVVVMAAAVICLLTALPLPSASQVLPTSADVGREKKSFRARRLARSIHAHSLNLGAPRGRFYQRRKIKGRWNLVLPAVNERTKENEQKCQKRNSGLTIGAALFSS